MPSILGIKTKSNIWSFCLIFGSVARTFQPYFINTNDYPVDNNSDCRKVTTELLYDIYLRKEDGYKEIRQGK